MVAQLYGRKLQQVIRQISPNSVNLLAPSLVQDLQEQKLNIREPDKLISSAEINVIKADILNKIKIFDKKRKLPYHNASHTEAVYKRCLRLLSASNLKPSQKQLLKFAALYHDYHYGIKKPLTSARQISFEEQSAFFADDHARALGLTLKQRLQLYGMIIGTTFLNPVIQPVTKMEKLLVIADLGGFTNSSKAWLVESIHVTLETPSQHRPANLTVWLNEQLNFLRYVKKRLTPEARNLNWQLSLDKKNTFIRKLLENPGFNKAYAPTINKLKRTLKSC